MMLEASKLGLGGLGIWRGNNHVTVSACHVLIPFSSIIF